MVVEREQVVAEEEKKNREGEEFFDKEMLDEGKGPSSAVEEQKEQKR